MRREENFLGPCQDCGTREWAARLSTPHGPIHLCPGCAADAIQHREGEKQSGNKYARLLARVFKPARAI